MGNSNRRSALSYVPGLKNNAVLQLIIFSVSSYLALAIAWAIIMIVDRGSDGVFHAYFLPGIALPPIELFSSHWWTIFTYGWFQMPNSFWEVFSSMLWLYCFGSLVQLLIGPKHVIPLFTYSLIFGGVAYLLVQFIPVSAGVLLPVFIGSRAGIFGLAVAAITLSPGYRFYLTETFAIPLVIVFGIFAALLLFSSFYSLPVLMLVIGGGLTGFLYVRALKAGYHPADWVYRILAWIEGLVTPAANVGNRRKGYVSYSVHSGRSGASHNNIDDILDKINQKGYKSLSKEERDILLRAGKE